MSKTILAVDDNEDQCALLKAAARAADVSYTLKLVSESHAALDYLNGKDQFGDRTRFPFPRLVLLDLHMPGMNGLELLSYIRSHPDLRALQVVILSTSDDTKDVQKAHRLGADAFLTKPCDFDDLTEIARALDTLLTQKSPLTRILGALASYQHPLAALF